MSPRAVSPRRSLTNPELDQAIAAAEAEAIIVWRGEQVRFDAVPELIARIDSREGRDRLYGAYLDALEALNPLYVERLMAWREVGDVAAVAAMEGGSDPRQLAVDLERFSLHAETPYYAALRRYLALIDIEQGDASEADVWHVVRGSSWANWFADREVARAVAGAGRAPFDAGDLDGWRAAERQLAGQRTGEHPIVAGAIGAAYASLVGSPEWVGDELGMVREEVAPFVDFAAFVRLWRMRVTLARLQYELRLYGTDDPALHRAYYSGIVGHLTGVHVGEGGYLHVIKSPFGSARALESEIMGAMLVEVLEQRRGLHWWRDPASTTLIESLAGASGTGDALADLGYDALDWRPVLRQIRTRLIGEMSGYGGPNITTRAGTRKV